MMFRPARTSSGHLWAVADEDLMHRAHRGDARAFGVIFDRHGGAAFSLAYRMCGRQALAEDIVQDAFLSLWRSARYDAARGSVRAWVLGAIHHKTIDAFRHETTKRGRDVNDAPAAERIPGRERPDVQIEQLDDARQVRGALERLPAEQRRVIELAYFGGFTHTQIANMLEVPAGTVKGRIRLGLTRMRLSLGDFAAEAGAV
jgi:RNA polymerase sigma-70 factor, ECF subfamily